MEREQIRENNSTFHLKQHARSVFAFVCRLKSLLYATYVTTIIWFTSVSETRMLFAHRVKTGDAGYNTHSVSHTLQNHAHIHTQFLKIKLIALLFTKKFLILY